MYRHLGLLLFIGVAWGQMTIAVFDLENNGLKDSEVRILTERLQSELVKVGSYTVVERKKIEKVFEEQKFQMSGCVEECLIEVGVLLGAKEIVIGSVGRIGSLYTVSARLVNATSGEMIRSSDFDSEGDISILLKSGMFRVASELTGRVLPPQTSRIAAAANNKSLGKGTLYITSSPSAAEVWVDGYKVEGVTPLTLTDLDVGTHTFQLIKDDKESTKTANIKANEINKLDVVLSLALADLDVFTDPAGAKVIIGRKAQKNRTPLTIKNLSVGMHKLYITMPTYLPIEENVRIEKNKNNQYSVKLVKEKGSITVSDKYPEGAVAELYSVVNNGARKFVDSHTLRGREVSWDVPPKLYQVEIYKNGYLNLIENVMVNVKSNIFISTPLESNKQVFQNVKDLRKKKKRSMMIGGIAMVFGGVAHLFANKLYGDYKVAGKNAGEIRKQIQTIDAMAIAFIGVGGTAFGLALNSQLKINQLNQKLQSSQKPRSLRY